MALMSAAVVLTGANGAPFSASPALADSSAMPWMNAKQPPDQRASEMAAQMTVAEKVDLVTGTAVCGRGADGYVAGDPALGLPDLNLVGAGAGVTDICHRAGDGAATELPAPIAMAASWDPQVAYADGALIGLQTRDLGFDVAIGGDVNLARDPRNGRTFEAEGEDPLLAGTIVGSQLRGTQSQDIPATVKHFAFNNEEEYRGTQSSNVDQRTMRELELRAFQIGIHEGDPAAVMCSYNLVNGTPACEDSFLLNTVLKQAWGFKGWVMTDWWACDPPLTEDTSEFCQTATAANAGLDQEQPNANFFGPELLSAIADGTVAQSRLDDMVHRILRSLFASGLIDHPVPSPSSAAEAYAGVQQPIDVTHGAAVAQQVEERSAVLLKNAHGILPLNRSTTRSIAVIGAPADTAPPEAAAGLTSSASVDPIDPDTPLTGLEAVNRKATISYNDGSSLASAAALARSAQVAIVYAKDTEEEGTIRSSLSLDAGSDALIEAVAAANPHTIVVLMTGSAVTMPWLRSVPAVLEAWYPGEQGGHAIAHLLFGDVNPSGSLPLTFPASESQLPDAGSPLEWPGTSSDIDYNEGLLLGYRWYDAKHLTPLFPFGFGLHYGARFVTSKLTVKALGKGLPTAAQVAADAPLAKVSFTITNLGRRTASAVVQAYTGFPSAVGEPPKRLFAWRKVSIAPRHHRRVAFTVTASAVDYWDTATNTWAVAAGNYPICVGYSDRDLRPAGDAALGRRDAETPSPCGRPKRTHR
jgi:beta-glucosidase